MKTQTRLALALWSVVVLGLASNARADSWDEVLAAARKEGSVVAVLGGSASRNYRPIFKHFEGKFGIRTVVSTGGGSKQGISGAGWLRTYFRIWVPLLMPTWILIATHSFVIAANTTSSIILLADRSTRTLSILALEFASPEIAMLEEASIISIFLIVLTVGLASVARAFGLRLAIQHEHRLTPGHISADTV